MAAKDGRKKNGKSCQFTLRITWGGIKFYIEIALSHTVSEIFKISA